MHRRIDVEDAEALLGDGDQFTIDIDPHECSRRESRRKHRQRDPASTSNFQNPLPLRQRKCANQERDLDPFLQPIPRFDIAEGDVVLSVVLAGGNDPRDGTLSTGLGRRRGGGATSAVESGWHENSLLLGWKRRAGSADRGLFTNAVIRRQSAHPLTSAHTRE